MFKKIEILMYQTSFRPKPWHFESDCPVCTWSASSFSCNPLNFLAHAMWVKWWYVPCQLSTISEFICSAFQFGVILAQNKSWNAWKIANEVRKGLKSDEVALNGAYWMQKKSSIKICFKNLKSFCNRLVFVQNPDTSKEIVQFVHEVHPVFRVTHSTF